MTDQNKKGRGYTALCAVGNTLRTMGRQVTDDELIHKYTELRDKD